jgi:hypothetical protein
MQRNRRIIPFVYSSMPSLLKFSNLGLLLMLCSPVLALAFAGWAAFFPVALASIGSWVICFLVDSTATNMLSGQLSAELIQDLVSVDQERRGLVLARLNPTERDWFLAELPLARAELRRRQWQPRTNPAARANVRWAWRLRILNKLA